MKISKVKDTYPIINLRETGINLRRIMDKRGIDAKDFKQYYLTEYPNIEVREKIYGVHEGKVKKVIQVFEIFERTGRDYTRRSKRSWI